MYKRLHSAITCKIITILKLFISQFHEECLSNFRYEDHNGIPTSVPISQQFREILETIYNSKYYVSDPKQACLFVPSLDLLNQNNIRLQETSQVLATLP